MKRLSDDLNAALYETVDLSENSFGVIGAKVLGTLLQNQPDLKVILVSSIPT